MSETSSRRKRLPSIALVGGGVIAAPCMTVIEWILNDPNMLELNVPSKVIGAMGAILTLIIGYTLPGGRHGEAQ